jgi:hypothetical protein
MIIIYIYIYIDTNVLNFVDLSGKDNNFEKFTGRTDDKSHGYDTASLMQYGAYAFSKNGEKTITAKNGASIGQKQGLSEGDVAQANTMYCGSTGGTGTGTGTCTGTGTETGTGTGAGTGRYCKM